VIVGRDVAACHTGRVSVTILDREMYTEAAAARLLRVAPSTLHWWLEGRPPRYRPVIRAEPTGSRNVTWAEFVEAGLLRSYRREHDVPLKELREFIDRLREEFQVPYPLADRRPYVGPSRRLLIDLQDRSHLDPEFCLVAIANGQTPDGADPGARCPRMPNSWCSGTRTRSFAARSAGSAISRAADCGSQHYPGRSPGADGARRSR
jgi:hypothetical protein